MLLRPVIAFLTGFAAFVPGGIATAQDGANACWTASDLAHRAGEEIVQKRVKSASVAPPKRQLAEFTPLSQRGVVRRVKLPPGRRLIALTFDLCEQPSEIAGYQGGIVDFLRSNRVKATFFFGGKWMLSHKARTQQLMSDPLFEVANHTWAHRNLRNLTGTALTEEIRSVAAAYEQVREDLAAKQCIGSDGHTQAARLAPKRLSLFRFPYGACSPQALAEVAEQGLLPIQWDVSSGDPAFALSATTMARNVIESVRPGSIVLFHANGRGWHTEGALPEIVGTLKAKGYQFVTVTELMAAGEPVMSATCYDARPGDTDEPRFPRTLSTGSRFAPGASSEHPGARSAPSPWSLFPPVLRPPANTPPR